MQRQRLTITLDTELLEGLDTLVDGDILRNRSQAIEHFISRGMKLHELSQLFLFISEPVEQQQLTSVLAASLKDDIRTLFLCLPAVLEDHKNDIHVIIEDFALAQGKEGFFTIHTIPLDFGSGAALLLQNAQLVGPFLVCWFGEHFSAPSSFLKSYLFHKKHGEMVTLFLTPTTGLHFETSGLALIQPDITTSIPAGVSNLQENIFPQLIKEGKVRGYVIT